MRVVLALDGSDSSIRARDLVAGLRWPAGTSITIVTASAVPVAWFAPSGPTGDWIPRAEEALRQEAADQLAGLATPLEDRGWAIERRVVLDRPASAILAAADEVDADLIVLGSRGRGPIRTMVLGSVAAEVATTARQSVLVARGGSVSRALAATDGSECASRIPEVLVDWRVFLGLPAVAVSVAQVESRAFEVMATIYTLGAVPLSEQREALIARHRQYATELAGRLTDVGMTAEADVRTGDAAHEIIAAASAHQADLIITGSRCLHGLDRWLLGSVARNVVLHAPVSVLIVRSRETSDEVSAPRD